MIPSKNTLVLIYTAIIAFGFFFAGLFDVLDYFIVKALLFGGVLLFFIYLFYHLVNDENKKSLENDSE